MPLFTVPDSGDRSEFAAEVSVSRRRRCSLAHVSGTVTEKGPALRGDR
jgi:hypothetical protein